MFILKEHYTVKPFSSGELALKYLEHRPADLILMDYHMPHISGGEVLEKLQADPRTSKIPVIFLTSTLNEDNESALLERGAMDYLHKPIRAKILLARVRLQLELQGYRHHMEQMVEARTRDLFAAYNKLQLREDITMGLLARVTDMRDHITGDHITRTTEFTRLIVSALLENNTPDYHVSEIEAAAIVQAAKLHDIGKIAVPDNILQKRAPLTPEEFDVVKRHPRSGAQLLDEFITRLGDDSFLNTAKDIVLYHHEKWDGGGYPESLRGNAIPLSARITALADVYDALTSARPYKEPFSHEKSVGIIVESTSRHFDPHLVAVFLGLEKQIQAAAQTF